jgi:serine/threonine-protein kinase
MSAMSHDPTPSLSGAADPELDRLIEELTRRVQAGEDIDLEAVAREHPGYSEPLRRLLPALELLAGLSQSVMADGLQGGGSGLDPTAGIGELGDFRLVREIGRGGMGVVYEAEQLSLRRRVALKVLPFAAALDARQIQRFRVEAQAAACLHHPHIVPVHGVGCERGVHYYAMQLIEGQSLAAIIAELRRLEGLDPADASAPGLAAISTTELAARLLTGDAADQARPAGAGPDTPTAAGTAPGRPAPSGSSTRSRDYVRAVARLALEAAEALDHAHAQGVLHRDIKPANLLLDAGGRLWVTDFGLAQVRGDDRLTCSGDVLGTLRYMSPEQALGRRVVIDGRTDVYSLGVTLYELLTLRPALDGRDRAEILRRIAEQEPTPPRRLNPAVPVDLETIVLKATSKDPAARYATAGDLAEDLGRFLEGEPVRARRPSLVDRAAKWTRRHRPVVMTAALLLVAGTAMSTWQAIRATRAGTLAAQREREARSAAAESKAVLEFLVRDMLGASEPEKALGRDVKVAEVLANAEKKVEIAFPDQPLVEAGVRHSLAVAFHALGQYDVALRHASRARALRLRLLGPEHPDTLRSMSGIADYWNHLGKRDEARKLAEQVLEVQRRVLGLEHRDTLSSMNNLAGVLDRQGKMDEARKLFEQALEIQRRVLGAEHVDTLDSMNSLATVLREQGKRDEARKLHEQTLEIKRRVLGPEHDDTLKSMNDLALALSAQRKADEARKLLEQTLEIQRRVLGAEHPDTLISMHNLAAVLGDQGKTDEARKLHEQTLEIQRRVLGPEHRNTLASMNCLATELLCQGKRDEARKLHEQTLEIQRRVLGAEHPQTLHSMNNLAAVLRDLGKSDEARKLDEQTLEIRRRVLGPEHPAVWSSLYGLVLSMLNGPEPPPTIESGHWSWPGRWPS